jgi:hypothetical protein
MTFGCTSCGACCRRLGLIINEIKKTGFPYNVNEKGHCEKLNENNKCTVYENRPDICRIDKKYGISEMTQKEYYLANAKLCNKWMEEDKIDERFKINEKQYI